MHMARRLACKAFNDVFQWKQTKYRLLLDWLQHQMEVSWPSSQVEAAGLLQVVDTSRSR
jgi:hypothetical protein